MTQSPDNWPDPERPGVPLFPEQDGIHLINMGTMIGMFWCSTRQHYSRVKDWKRGMSPADVSNFEYCGPCFTPTQISEMLAAERERCADKVSVYAYDQRHGIVARYALQTAESEIRNLGAAS